MSDTTTPTITLRSSYPYAFLVDGDDGDQVIPLQIARFTVEHAKAFTARRGRVLEPPSLRAIYRQPEGDEQEKVEKIVRGQTTEVFVVSDQEIRRRRISEMTDDRRRWFDDQSAADAAAEYDFLVETVVAYITVAPSARVLFERPDGTTLTLRTGADLVEAFGGHLQQLHRLVDVVWAENTLQPAQKKTWRWLSDLSRSWGAPRLAAPGLTPDATAAPAASAVSAGSAGATAAIAASPSGSTTTSRSARARSSHSPRSSRTSSRGSVRRMTSSSESV